MFETLVPIRLIDAFSSNKLIPSSTDIQIQLHRADSEFCLMTRLTEKLAIQYNVVRAVVKRVTLSEGAEKGLLTSLGRSPAIYPIIQREIRAVSTPQIDRLQF